MKLLVARFICRRWNPGRHARFCGLASMDLAKTRTAQPVQWTKLVSHPTRTWLLKQRSDRAAAAMLAAKDRKGVVPQGQIPDAAQPPVQRCRALRWWSGSRLSAGWDRQRPKSQPEAGAPVRLQPFHLLCRFDP